MAAILKKLTPNQWLDCWNEFNLELKLGDSNARADKIIENLKDFAEFIRFKFGPAYIDNKSYGPDQQPVNFYYFIPGQDIIFKISFSQNDPNRLHSVKMFNDMGGSMRRQFKVYT